MPINLVPNSTNDYSWIKDTNSEKWYRTLSPLRDHLILVTLLQTQISPRTVQRIAAFVGMNRAICTYSEVASEGGGVFYHRITGEWLFSANESLYLPRMKSRRLTENLIQIATQVSGCVVRRIGNNEVELLPRRGVPIESWREGILKAAYLFEKVCLVKDAWSEHNQLLPDSAYLRYDTTNKRRRTLSSPYYRPTTYIHT